MSEKIYALLLRLQARRNSLSLRPAFLRVPDPLSRDGLNGKSGDIGRASFRSFRRSPRCCEPDDPIIPATGHLPGKADGEG